MAVLDVAWRAGVRYFDAARSYGRAEEFLGAWLRARQTHPAPWRSVQNGVTSTGEQVRSNIRATEVAWDGEAQAALATLAEPPELYWQTRKRLAWN